jgi:hypothetical protein
MKWLSNTALTFQKYQNGFGLGSPGLATKKTEYSTPALENAKIK